MEWGLGTSDTLWNSAPVSFGEDLLNGYQFSIEHVPGADTAAPIATASGDLSLWNVPLSLTKRELLPTGKLRSTWRTVQPQDRLFWKIRTGE